MGLFAVTLDKRPVEESCKSGNEYPPPPFPAKKWDFVNYLGEY
jgi:hypothetical protein